MFDAVLVGNFFRQNFVTVCNVGCWMGTVKCKNVFCGKQEGKRFQILMHGWQDDDKVELAQIRMAV